ncbi:MAG TPA: hypothetical protein VF624_13920 [Tepidisphaeraceae bacterium]|jgi:hypothetical protein
MRTRPLIRLAVAAVVAFGALSDSAVAPAPARPAASGETVAAIRPLAVRIRRLHRVRPDLLHYPMTYEILC